MPALKTYRDRLDPRPGFPIRRASVDEVMPHVQPLSVVQSFPWERDRRGQGA